MILRLLSAITLLVLSTALLPTVTTAEAPPPRRWMYLAHFETNVQTLLRAHLNDLDVISPNYFKVDIDGAITSKESAAIQSIVAKTPVRVIPMIQNDARYDDFTTMISNPATRKKIIDQLVKIVTERGFAGINIDFEGLNGADRASLNTFMAELTPRFRSIGKLSTIAVPAKPRETTTGWAGAYDYAALGAVSDYLVLMTYAHQTVSDPPGSTAPIEWVQRTVDFAAASVPRNKLFLGVGLWGYDWKITPGATADVRVASEIDQLAKTAGAQYGYSLTDESAYLKYKEGADDRVVWYEDERALTAKLKVAFNGKLAGWAAWRLGQEGPQAWNAFASYNKWVKGQGTPEQSLAELSSRTSQISSGQSQSAVAAPPAAPPPAPKTTVPPPGVRDWAIPNGHFYNQTGDLNARTGFAVTDDDGVLFWKEFQKLGGVDAVGFPRSARFLWNGLVTQVFQKAIFQWSAKGEVNFINVFDELSAAGKDNWLAKERSTPKPLGPDFDANKTWDQILTLRLGLLDKQPKIKDAYMAKGDPLRYYGLPTSEVVDNTNHYAVRLQRAVMQLWKVDVPWAKAGSITIANGGDIAIEAGLIPAEALSPRPTP